MGNQGASGDGTRWIEAAVQEGLIGEVREVDVWTNRPVWPQGVPLPKGTMPVPEEVSWDLWLGTAPWRDYNEAFMPTRWERILGLRYRCPRRHGMSFNRCSF